MRKIIPFFLLSSFLVATVFASEFNTPLSETDTQAFTESQIFELPPLMQKCIIETHEIKEARQENLAQIVLESEDYRSYNTQKETLRTIKTAGAYALVAAGAKFVFDLVSPYAEGFASQNYPSIAEKFDTLANKIPNSPYTYPAAAVSVSALGALVYASRAFRQPLALDANSLAKVKRSTEIKNAQLDTQDKYVKCLYDTLLVETDDFALLNELLQKQETAIASLQEHMNHSGSHPADLFEKLTELKKDHTALTAFMHQIGEISLSHGQAESSKAVAVAHSEEIETRLVEKRKHKKPFSLKKAGIWAAGLGAALRTANTTTRAPQSLDPISTLAVGSWAIITACDKVEDYITQGYLYKLEERLKKSEQAGFTRFQQAMEDATLEQLAAHQEAVRRIGQTIDIKAIDIDQIKEKIGKTAPHEIRSEISEQHVAELVQYQQDTLQAAQQLVAYHIHNKNNPA